MEFSEKDIYEARTMGFVLTKNGYFTVLPSVWGSQSVGYRALVYQATKSMDSEHLASRIILSYPILDMDFGEVDWALFLGRSNKFYLSNITYPELTKLANDGHVIAIKALRELTKQKLRG